MDALASRRQRTVAHEARCRCILTLGAERAGRTRPPGPANFKIARGVTTLAHRAVPGN